MKDKHCYDPDQNSLKSTVFLYIFFLLCVLSPFLALFGNFTGFDLLIIAIVVLAFLDPKFTLPKTLVLASLVLILASCFSLIYTVFSFTNYYEALLNFGQIIFIRSTSKHKNIFFIFRVSHEIFYP